MRFPNCTQIPFSPLSLIPLPLFPLSAHSTLSLFSFFRTELPRPKDSLRAEYPSYLQHLQLLQPVLHQFLYPPTIALGALLSECVPRPPLGVFPEVVCGELVALSEKGAVLFHPFLSAYEFFQTCRNR